MNDIKLFVSCHQPVAVAKHPLLFSIQVGAALADTHFPDCLHDDTGDNISVKNRSYCELTAQYWAWKNVQADYYGFFHYRRYLYPDLLEKRPYRFFHDPSGPWPEELGYAGFRDLIEKYDMIVPIAEDMHVSAREHYAAAPFHHKEDLALAEAILAELYPDCLKASERYLSGTKQFFGNIFIMRRELFSEYCSFLFPLLENYDRRADHSGYGPQELRVDGYLAERLLGVFINWKGGGLKILELPRAVFVPAQKYLPSVMLNMLLPPGSRRRAAVKNCLKKS